MFFNFTALSLIKHRGAEQLRWLCLSEIGTVPAVYTKKWDNARNESKGQAIVADPHDIGMDA
jgi:hypothetical protein